MTTAPVTPAQPPLGPLPPPTDSECFADQVRVRGEPLTALEIQVAGCNELIKDFKSQLEGLQGEEGVEEGPRDFAFAIPPMILAAVFSQNSKSQQKGVFGEK